MRDAVCERCKRYCQVNIITNTRSINFGSKTAAYVEVCADCFDAIPVFVFRRRIGGRNSPNDDNLHLDGGVRALEDDN